MMCEIERNHRLLSTTGTISSTTTTSPFPLAASLPTSTRPSSAPSSPRSQAFQPPPNSPLPPFVFLQDAFARRLFGHNDNIITTEKSSETLSDPTKFAKNITARFTSRLTFLLRNPANHPALLRIGYEALEAFLRTTVTGPPLAAEDKDDLRAEGIGVGGEGKERGFHLLEVVFPKLKDVQRFASGEGDQEKEGADSKNDVFYYRWQAASALRRHLASSLAVQGQAVYRLAPHVELFWLAKVILSDEQLCGKDQSREGSKKEEQDVGKDHDGRLARMRVNFWHQKLLSEPSDHLREELYRDAEVLKDLVLRVSTLPIATAPVSATPSSTTAANLRQHAELLIEMATIDTFYGNEVQARKKLWTATKMRGFNFVLTGVLGKRTKFQQNDVSQLVVLAKSSSRDDQEDKSVENVGLAIKRGHQRHMNSPAEQQNVVQENREGNSANISNMTDGTTATTLSLAPTPENIAINDDTILDSIHFSPQKNLPKVAAGAEEIPSTLKDLALDPSNQPLLDPLDSIILLQIASSISNTSPADGLTREETMPYATRVLTGGSSNWQVYTQALLERSRIEGHRSRTAERGLLQLQALVDQVILQTSPATTVNATECSASRLDGGAATSFLPKPRPSEPASAAERLRHIYQLHSPFRWELEAELAARWVSVGGLKTALDIYKRLEMDAEVALCLAATDNEAKASRWIRDLLFKQDSMIHGDGQEEKDKNEAEAEAEAKSQRESATAQTEEIELDELPPDAPRLFCILGDLENQLRYYERAWEVSGRRYSRAQRSLGRYHSRHSRDLMAAAEAYSKSLAMNRLDAPTWFALGCVQLELPDFYAAVESFSRAVQLKTEDAEAWSNLAAALMRLPDQQAAEAGQIYDNGLDRSAEEADKTRFGTTRFNRQEQALNALRQAARLKQSDARIWDNFLTVAASFISSSNHQDNSESDATTANDHLNDSSRITTTPPPWSGMIQAQSKLIDLRGSSLGEKSIDETILSAIVRHVQNTYPHSSSHPQVPQQSQPSPQTTSQQEEQKNADTSKRRPGSLPFLLETLLMEKVKPLITSSPRLWTLIAATEEWRGDLSAALDASEKAWRAALRRYEDIIVVAGDIDSQGDRERRMKQEKKRGGDVGDNDHDDDDDDNHPKISSLRLLVAVTLDLVRIYRIEAVRSNNQKTTTQKFKARNAVKKVLTFVKTTMIEDGQEGEKEEEWRDGDMIIKANEGEEEPADVVGKEEKKKRENQGKKAKGKKRGQARERQQQRQRLRLREDWMELEKTLVEIVQY